MARTLRPADFVPRGFQVESVDGDGATIVVTAYPLVELAIGRIATRSRHGSAAVIVDAWLPGADASLLAVAGEGHGRTGLRKLLRMQWSYYARPAVLRRLGEDVDQFDSLRRARQEENNPDLRLAVPRHGGRSRIRAMFGPVKARLLGPESNPGACSTLRMMPLRTEDSLRMA